MALSTQPVKGARDFYPEDMRLRKYVFSKWREVCERFGYEEYDAPIVEPTDLYLSKGNEEIITEQTYSFTDRGGRNLTLRTEMTPTVSRMVAAKRQELAYPARWYSIPQCWRYERMQRGRGREFYQLNADVFGLSGIESDLEIIQLADAIMRSFKAKREMYAIKINSRAFTNALLIGYLGLDATQSATMIRLIDRMNKLPAAEFTAQVDAVFSPSQRDAGKPNMLFNFLNHPDLETLPVELANSEPIGQLKKLMAMLAALGITNASFDPALMRGFDYYTDIVFEVFDTHPDNNRSMFGGGRYDGLVESFGVEPIPTVGFAMGDITLANFLESHKLLPPLRPETDLYIALIGDVIGGAQTMVAELRQMGVNAALDSTGRPVDKQIKTAVKKGIRYVMFVGQKELDQQLFALKDLETGLLESHSLQRIVSTLKDFRHKK